MKKHRCFVPRRAIILRGHRGNNTVVLVAIMQWLSLSALYDDECNITNNDDKCIITHDDKCIIATPTSALSLTTTTALSLTTTRPLTVVGFVVGAVSFAVPMQVTKVKSLHQERALHCTDLSCA